LCFNPVSARVVLGLFADVRLLDFLNTMPFCHFGHSRRGAGSSSQQIR
jgi:hypothetical protein